MADTADLGVPEEVPTTLSIQGRTISLPPGVKPEDLMALSIDSRQATLLVAGLATLFATNICMNVIMKHLHFWRRPREQRAIIAIICMVPLFALDSYIALADMPGSEVVSTIFDSIKECYEAFVISEFLVLLFAYMGVPLAAKAPVPDTVKGRALHNSFPLTLFLPHEMKVDKSSLNLLLFLARQFVVVRPIFSVLMCGLELLGLYRGVVPWAFLLVFNVSVYLAVYSLLLFYHTFEKELAPHKPFAKFLCIKGVVFFAFWQGLVVRLLVSYGVINASHMPFTVRQVEEAVQNFLVCVEMLLFSLVFRYAFSSKEYEHLEPLAERPPERAAKRSPPQPQAAAAVGGGRVSAASAPTSAAGKDDTKKDK